MDTIFSITSPLNNILLGDTQEQIDGELGTPLMRTDKNDVEIFWYTSKSPVIADFVYLRAGEVAMKSLSVFSQDVPIQQYIDQFGPPAHSVRKYPPQFRDPTRETIHVWPDQGIAIISLGNSLGSKVIREQQFLPTNLETYLSTWWSDLVTSKNEVVAVTGILSETTAALPAPTPLPNQISNFILDHAVQLLVVTVFLLVLMLGVFFWKRRRS